jgi:hypothetical protein
MSAELADILDDHDESNYAGNGVHLSGDLSARPTGERQPEAGPTRKSTFLVSHKLARLGGYLARARIRHPETWSCGEDSHALPISN